MKILGYIPARLGSERVRAKNLRLLAGRPLVSYAIETCQRASTVERFFLNTEADEIAAVGREYGIDVYRRDPSLALSDVKTDEIVIDFLQHNPCDVVVLINPTAPFLTASTIDNAVSAFLKSESDALFSCNFLRKHALIGGRSLNFDFKKRSPRTQDLEPIQYINFIICVFRARSALENYNEHGSFLYRGKLCFWEMPEDQSIDIDYDLEFRMIEAMLIGGANAPEYHGGV